LPFFVVYLLTDAARSTSLWVLGGSTFTDIYRAAWIYSEPLMLAFNVLLVLEVIRVLYKAYPGIHSFAKIAISLAIIVAILVTVFSAPLDIRRPTMTASDRTLLHFFQAERVLDLGLCLITAVIVGLFPSAPYGKRVRQHGILLSALFAFASAGFFAINYGFDSEITGFLTLMAQLVLYLLWIRIFLAPEPLTPAIPPPEEIARVKELNDDLLFLARWLSK